MATTNLSELRAASPPQTQPAKKDANPVAVFSGFLDKLKPQLALALPKHLNADRMARLALTAFSASADLQKCTAQSIAGSLMTAGQMGLEPGVNGQGYLIPYFDNRNRVMVCTFVPGWRGLVDLVARAGRATVWTGVVYPGDEFDYQLGDSPFCRHKPGDALGDDISGGWTHVYAIGRVRDAQMPVIEVWSRNKVKRHLETYNKVGDRHYAKKAENNFEMYGRKVALLQVLKYMPQSVEIANATKVADMADTGRGVVFDGDLVRFVDDGDSPRGTPDPVTGEIEEQQQPTGKPAPASLADNPTPRLSEWTPTEAEAVEIARREAAEAGFEPAARAAPAQQQPAGRRTRAATAID
jgi:recombination protein RecT